MNTQIAYSQSLHLPVAAHLVMRPTPVPTILLIDDDPLFGKVMQRVAASLNAKLTFIDSVARLPTPDLCAFDVAIVDYDLGSVTGVELAAWLDHCVRPMPIVMVSSTTRRQDAGWSENIHEFIHKALGPLAIIDAAFEAHEIFRIHERMRSPALPVRTQH